MTDSLEIRKAVVGSRIPVLLDYAVGLQFPCRRPFDYKDGVAETLVNQILSDWRRTVTSWDGYFGGGPLGWIQMLSRPDTIPSYLRDDWSRDWGEIEVLLSPPVSTTVPARLDRPALCRSGLWPPGPVGRDLSLR